MSTIEITVLVAVFLAFLILPAVKGMHEARQGSAQREAEMVNLLSKEKETC